MGIWICSSEDDNYSRKDRMHRFLCDVECHQVEKQSRNAKWTPPITQIWLLYWNHFQADRTRGLRGANDSLIHPRHVRVSKNTRRHCHHHLQHNYYHHHHHRCHHRFVVFIILYILSVFLPVVKVKSKLFFFWSRDGNLTKVEGNKQSSFGPFWNIKSLNSMIEWIIL